jgi:molecular chaperone GrpE
MAEENGSQQRAAAGAEGGTREPADRVADLEAQLVELEERWRRALADFDNLRKRVTREAHTERVEERARVAREWLPVLDNLDRALEHAGADPKQIVQGVRAVRDQAVEVLARLGFPRRADVGQPFDPVRHEAVATVADLQAAPGTVLDVVQPGYGDGEHQLRPASVVVATRDD